VLIIKYLVKMEKFEYIIEVEYKKLLPKEWLNKRGSEGWELVSTVDDIDEDGEELLRYYFKRKIINN
jgi:hypothetical protein